MKAGLPKVGINSRMTTLRSVHAAGFSIVVYTKCTDSVQPGQVFMPRAIWSNVVIDPDTLSTGSPLYKGAPVTIEPTEEEVLSAEDVVLKVYVRGE